MELASMLAGEAFSDHPRSVSPLIAAFLRAYNDMLDDTRRQDLYGCAAKVVGSAAGRAAERARIARLVEWAREQSALRARCALVARIMPHLSVDRRSMDADSAARDAIYVIRRLRDDPHPQVLALIDELVALGAADQPEPSAQEGSAQAQLATSLTP
jgi:hypothetical protein